MKKRGFGAGTAAIFKRLRQSKAELLLVAAALLVFALLWGADALINKPVEIYVPAQENGEVIIPAETGATASADTQASQTVLQEETQAQLTTTAQQEQTSAVGAQTQTTAATTAKTPTTTTQATSASSGLVNVNTADSAQLQLLPGIGPVKAQAIIDYRLAHGVFSSAEELLNVKGIGEKTLEKMLPYLLF
jgi:competence protein ComEA